MSIQKFGESPSFSYPPSRHMRNFHVPSGRRCLTTCISSALPPTNGMALVWSVVIIFFVSVWSISVTCVEKTRCGMYLLVCVLVVVVVFGAWCCTLFDTRLFVKFGRAAVVRAYSHAVCAGARVLDTVLWLV
jgi:hypothetical protein